MQKRTFPRPLMVTLVLALVFVTAGGIWYYRAQEQRLRDRAEEELQAIAQLKVEQLAAWRAERIADAAVLRDSPTFVAAVTQWLSDPQDEQAETILRRLRTLQTHYGYSDAFLIDVQFEICLGVEGQSVPLSEDARQAITTAWHNRQPVLTDLHILPDDQMPHIDIITPLFDNAGTDAEPVGAVMIRSDATTFLYPLIQSWPTPSDSAETLLVRRDGDAVLFLNDLRHQPGSALMLRIPLNQTDVPAVMAVTGTTGVVRGKDYRGVEVLAAIFPIPDSPWFIIAKEDTDEILADWERESSLIVGLIAGTLAVIGTVVGVIWQSNEKAHVQRLYQAEKARLESEMRYQTVLLSIGDGIIVTDVEGRVELLNPAAERLTGWSRADARGQPLEAVFRIVSEDTREPVANPVRQVLREGIIVGLANHTLLIAKDGREIPIADSGAPVQRHGDVISGVVLAFQDQTDERAAQNALRESEEYIRTVLDNLPIGVAVNSVDPDVTFSYINDNFVRFYRTTREALAESDSFWEAVYEDTDFREIIKRRVLEDVASGDPARMRWDDVPITRKGEETTYISAMNAPIRGTDLMLSAVWDTTERKRTEDARREQHMLTEALRDTAAALISAMDIDAVMTTLLANVARVVPHDASNIMMITGDQAQVVYSHGYPDDLDRPLHNFHIAIPQTPHLQEMLTTKSPFLIAQTRQYATWQQDPLTDWVQSYVAVPIRSRENVVGFLNLDSSTPGFFTNAHAERLQAFADLASIAIEHAQLYEQIQRHAGELEQRVIERTYELNHAKERTEAILTSSSDVMILIQADGIITQVNPAFKTVFECTTDEALGQPCTALVIPDHIPRMQQAIDNVMASRQSQRLEVTAHCRTGKTFDADIVLSPIVDHDRHLLGVVCNVRDITLHKRMETQLRQTLEQEMALNELKTRYVSMAAHDLRNPLAVIRSSVDLIRQYGDRLSDEQTQEKYDRIYNSIQIMVDMLDDILLLEKVEAGKLSFNPAPMDIIALCEKIIEDTSHAIGAAQHITFDVQGECGAVSVDAKLLRHVLGNLLSNAIKYSPDDSTVSLTIRCAEDHIVFQVEDQGIGIPDVDQARLFEAFHRASNAKSIPGTGLGLAIVKQSVEVHGGTINFESHVGVGTTFTVTLPRVSVEQGTHEDNPDNRR